MLASSVEGRDMSIDYLGAQGGQLSMAFGAGVVACWTFVKAFVSRPVDKANKTQITMLIEDKNACHARVTQLETILYFHGGGDLRNAMQKSLSEQHIEMIEQHEALKEKE